MEEKGIATLTIPLSKEKASFLDLLVIIGTWLLCSASFVAKNKIKMALFVCMLVPSKSHLL